MQAAEADKNRFDVNHAVSAAAISAPNPHRGLAEI